jgi:hypothetical protein
VRADVQAEDGQTAERLMAIGLVPICSFADPPDQFLVFERQQKKVPRF